MRTKVSNCDQVDKLCVEHYEFKLHDNVFECSVLYENRLSEPWKEWVTIEQIRAFVTNKSGQVDVSLISPSRQPCVQFLEFDYYMSHEFEHEAHLILANIINGKEQKKEVA